MKASRTAALALTLVATALPGWSAQGATTSRGARMVLPFIQDDYAKARAQARARKVPLFIEAWAPW